MIKKVEVFMAAPFPQATMSQDKTKHDYKLAVRIEIRPND